MVTLNRPWPNEWRSKSLGEEKRPTWASVSPLMKTEKWYFLFFSTGMPQYPPLEIPPPTPEVVTLSATWLFGVRGSSLVRKTFVLFKAFQAAGCAFLLQLQYIRQRYCKVVTGWLDQSYEMMDPILWDDSYSQIVEGRPCKSWGIAAKAILVDFYDTVSIGTVSFHWGVGFWFADAEASVKGHKC